MADDMKPSAQLKIRNLQFNDSAFFQRVLHEHMGQNRNAKPLAGRVDKRLRARALPGRV